MRTTRIVVSSAARAVGSAAAYDADLPSEIRDVHAVTLMAVTIPYPAALLVPGAYVVLRIDGMEVTASNDDVINRAFVVLPCLDKIEKILPTTYTPVRPVRRLARLRVSFVDAAGALVDFQGAEHILQFDVQHGDAGPASGLMVPVLPAANSADAPVDPPPGPAVPEPAGDAPDFGTELDALLQEGYRRGAEAAPLAPLPRVPS